MKTTFKLSALVLAMALTACSSSGGSEHSSLADHKDKGVVEQTTQTGNTGSQSGSTNGNGDQSTTQGGATNDNNTTNSGSTVEDKKEPVVKYYGGKHQTMINFRSTDFDLEPIKENKLIVEGKEIDVSTLPANAKTELKYSRFGYFTEYEGIENHTFTNFSQGELTNESKINELSGQAEYRGSAFYNDENALRFNMNSELSVDFGAKTVNGRVYNSQENVNIEFPTATISGNEFKNDEVNGSRVRGNFYGENAEEIGGLFKGGVGVNGADVSISFGAIKQ